MAGKTVIIRMEVRDRETWEMEKSVSVALPQAQLDAMRAPFDIVRHHAALLFQALRGVGPEHTP